MVDIISSTDHTNASICAAQIEKITAYELLALRQVCQTVLYEKTHKEDTDEREIKRVRTIKKQIETLLEHRTLTADDKADIAHL